MKTEYRIVATMTFDNEADRDAWYTAVRTNVINARNSGQLPTWEKANMTKDDYHVASKITEDMQTAS